MLSEFLADLDGAAAPFASVALDASRLDRAGGDDVVQRWRARADRLLDAGAPQPVVQAMGERATAPTGLGGELTRVVVASGDSVALDAVLAWALVGSSAEASIVDPEELELTEGIAALLRWSDEATEHDRAPSMPGHGQAPGASENLE